MGTPGTIDLGTMDVVIPTKEEMREFLLKQCRPIIQRICIRAEQQMAIHDPEKGDSWKTCHFGMLEQHLLDEVNEYFSSYDKSPQLRALELDDIVAMCAMLSARLRGWE